MYARPSAYGAGDNLYRLRAGVNRVDRLTSERRRLRVAAVSVVNVHDGSTRRKEAVCDETRGRCNVARLYTPGRAHPRVTGCTITRRCRVGV